jgi:tRNA threonylcarbamoyladenosine biosynthesis protein TsaE
MHDHITVPTAEAMRTLGRRLAAQLRAGDLVILGGPLGAGKTTLVQGIADGLGVRGPITSPTFVIARVHPALGGGPDLVHADAYRLASPAEVDDLDLDTTLDRSVTVVEWGGGLAEGLASDRLEVTIEPADAPNAPAPGTAWPAGPVTPGPDGPASATPGPVTPGPDGPATATPGPVTPGPASPASATPGSDTPAPPGAATPAPATPAPATSAPVTPAPATPAPAAQDPRDATELDRAPRRVTVTGHGPRWQNAADSSFLVCLAGPEAV